MSQVAPARQVYQTGTLAGNPLAVQAGLATLQCLTGDIYERLEQTAARAAASLESAATAAGIPLRVYRVGSMLTAFSTHDPPVATGALSVTADQPISTG